MKQYIRTKEIKAKISETLKKRWNEGKFNRDGYWLNKHFSPEHKLKIKKSCIGKNKGKFKSNEEKKRLSETKKRLYSEGKWTPWMKGKSHSKESLQKISDKLKGMKAWNKKYLDEKEVIRLYVEELKNPTEIGKMFDCSCRPIIRILKENSIDTNLSKRKKELFNKGKLKTWNKGLTKEDERVKKYVDKLCGRKLSIESRLKMREKAKELWNDKNYKNKRLKYYDNIRGKTFEQIHGEEKAQKIKDKMSIKNSGENNYFYGKRGELAPTWNGGSSFIPYTKEFNKYFKEFIKQRDNYTCLKCNLFELDSKKLYKKGLAIHHIDYIKENTFKENCCALCVRCNAEVNFNRNHFIKFFQSLLSERYGYKYTEDNKIILNVGGNGCGI